jgi:hypothetical protein
MTASTSAAASPVAFVCFFDAASYSSTIGTDRHRVNFPLRFRACPARGATIAGRSAASVRPAGGSRAAGVPSSLRSDRFAPLRPLTLSEAVAALRTAREEGPPHELSVSEREQNSVEEGPGEELSDLYEADGQQVVLREGCCQCKLTRYSILKELLPYHAVTKQS